MSLTHVSTSTAAQILDVSPRTIERKAAAGELTKYVVGTRTVRFDRAEVEALARRVKDAKKAPRRTVEQQADTILNHGKGAGLEDLAPPDPVTVRTLLALLTSLVEAAEGEAA